VAARARRDARRATRPARTTGLSISARDADDPRDAHEAYDDVTLEPLKAEHAGELFPLLADEELWSFTDSRPPESEAALRERYRRLESRRSPDRTQEWLNWAVRTNDGIAGFVQATLAVGGDEVEVAYVIARRFQHRGIGRRAVDALIADVTSTRTVTRVVATIDARNLRSIELVRALDFACTDASDPTRLRYERTLAR
jgi:RimJ/RimL family protein N-acetyltransferase